MKTLSDILETLIREHPDLLKKDGSINQNAVARFTGVNQPTIKRILDGESGQPRADNIEKLAKAFRCSQAVIRGEVELDSRLSGTESSKPYSGHWTAATKDEKAALTAARTHPEETKAFVQFLGMDKEERDNLRAFLEIAAGRVPPEKN